MPKWWPHGRHSQLWAEQRTGPGSENCQNNVSKLKLYLLKFIWAQCIHYVYSGAWWGKDIETALHCLSSILTLCHCNRRWDIWPTPSRHVSIWKCCWPAICRGKTICHNTYVRRIKASKTRVAQSWKLSLGEPADKFAARASQRRVSYTFLCVSLFASA